MKQLNSLRLSLLFTGCFLGAGYVSGQELWQFFGAYGLGGYFGLAIAVALLFSFGVLILRLVQRSGETELDRVVIPWDVPALHAAVGVLEVVFMFGIATVMNAGIGALLERLFSVPVWLGCLVFTALLLAASLAGLGGIVSAFSVSVPILVAATVAFGLLTVSRHDLSAVRWAFTSNENPLLGNWLAAAFTFACYNIFGTIGIMIPFGSAVRDRRTVYRGLALGAAALLAIALSVLLSLTLCPAAAEAALPMLEIASDFSPACAYVYALLLALAMFGTSLSSFGALLHFLAQKFSPVRQRRKLLAALLAAASYAGSLFGFGDLIAVLYPLFGYASAIFLVLMLLHDLRLRRSGSKTNKEEV